MSGASTTGAAVASLGGCLWLRYGRRQWSWLMNLFYRSQRRSLPVVQSILEIESVLQQIKWAPDRCGDWIQSAELTWGLKRGDCEDFAWLAEKLLKQLNIEGWMLSILLNPAKYSHAICVFIDNDNWFYFSNSKLIETRYHELYNKMNYQDGPSPPGNLRLITGVSPDIYSLVQLVRGKNTLVCWSLENSKGKIVRFGK